MKLLCLLLLCLPAWAQIQRPTLGVMLDENGRARLVTGTPAAAVLGDPLFAESVLSLACSTKFCLAKTESALVSSAGETAGAPPGRALIALDGDDAYIYFVETRQLARWSGGDMEPIDFAPEGDVLSIRATADGFECALLRDGVVWVGDRNLGVANTVLLLDSGVLLAADGRVRVLRPDGTEKDIALANAESSIGGFIRMSDRYVQVISDSGMWLLDTEEGAEQISLLPGSTQ